MISTPLTMKAIIFLALIAYAAAAAFDLYDLEKLDMEKLSNNHDEFKSFIDCLMDREECSKRFSPFRAITAEAVEQFCKRCTPYQKHCFWQFLQGIMAKFPEEYHNFRHKYDPESKYFENLESELKKYSKGSF